MLRRTCHVVRKPEAFMHVLLLLTDLFDPLSPYGFVPEFDVPV